LPRKAMSFDMMRNHDIAFSATETVDGKD